MLRRQQTSKNLSAAPPPLPPPAATVKKEELEALSTKVDEMREHLEAVTKAIAAQLNVALDTIDANLRASRDESARLDAKVDDALRVIASSEQAIEERVATTLENRTAEMQTTLDERSARITVDTEFKLEQAEARLAARLTDSVQDAQSVLNALGAKVDATVGEINAKVDSSAAEQASRHERLNEAVGRIRDDLASTTVALRHEMEQTAEIISTRLASRADEMRVELANLRSLLDSSRAELSERLAKVSEQATGTAFTLMQLQEKVGEVDVNALNELRERVSSVAGEGALVRIEMDRLTSSIDDRFDKISLRMADIDAKLDADEDVSLAVQLDRLDELERAISELDPDRFVLKDEHQRPPAAPDGDAGSWVQPGEAGGGWAQPGPGTQPMQMNGHSHPEHAHLHVARAQGYAEGSGW